VGRTVEQVRNDRTIAHLIEAILTRNNNIPNFALLVGSGASATSGIDGASQMVDRWRRRLYERSGARQSYPRWVRRQYWHGSDDEYALLFELMYDQPALRRAHIEECLRNAHPGWGYVYLTNLLKNNVFNVVLTTNFDDLIQEACYLYSDSRPIVCAHDSAVSGIRVASARPKIIKLHGDYLFDNIKNTVRELETLEDNMKRKFMQFAQDYGLVVVGYSGRDRSVMDIVDMIVKQDEYFKQGVYWCERVGDKRGKRLSSLLRRDKVYTVTIPGFDELMAEIHEEAGFELPEPIANPIWIAKDRAQLFINIPSTVAAHSVISRDIGSVLDAVTDIMSLSEQPKVRPLVTSRLPSSLRAAALTQQRQLESALDELRKARDEDPDDEGVAYEMANVLARLYRKDELKSFVLSSPIPNTNKTYFLLHTGDDEAVIAMADKTLSDDPSDDTARINRAISLKRVGRTPEMESELSIIESQAPLVAVRAGVAALRGDKGLMLQLLEQSLAEHLISPDDIEMFPVFEDHWQDEDLLKLIEKWRKGGVDKRAKMRYYRQLKQEQDQEEGDTGNAGKPLG